MKTLVLFILVSFFLVSSSVVAAEKCTTPWSCDKKGILDKILNKDKKVNNDIVKEKTKKIKEKEKSKSEASVEKCTTPWSCNKKSWLDKLLEKDKDVEQNKIVKKEKTTNKYFSENNDIGQNISVYTGTFDTIDKEGDDKTSLAGIEHKNKDLFRNTWIGRFSPTTGAFISGKKSVYLYTGIEADYNLGPINISPSFAPGYYEAGDGKNLGSALEFKSEIKVGVNFFRDMNLGYSYSHISNNDWGDTNPGTDNQSLTLSKKF